MDINGKKLYRLKSDKKIAGVCAGIAEYFDMDVSLVRLITILLVFVAGMSIWVYIIAAIVIPEEPLYRDDIKRDDFNTELYKDNPFINNDMK